MRIICLSVLAGAVATPVVACDLCSIYAAAEASGGAGRGFFAGVAEQHTHFGTLQDSGHKIANDGEFIDSSVTQFFAGFNFNDRFSLQLNVPVIHRSFGSDTDRGRENGLGDITLLGSYRIFEKFEENSTVTWSVLGGLKMPTGDSIRLNDPNFANGIGGHDLALGSGSFDGVIGTAISARWKTVFFTASTQYAIRSEGDFQHQYANDLSWAGGPGLYLALKDKFTVGLQALVSGEYKGKDTFAGVTDDDSAETVVYVGPQVNFTWKSKLSGQIGADIPVSIYGSGVQVVTDYRIRAGLNWRF